MLRKKVFLYVSFVKSVQFVCAIILGSGVISPASLIISCIGATYRQTKLTTAGIIISSVMLLLFLIGSCFVYYYLSHEEY